MNARSEIVIARNEIVVKGSEIKYLAHEINSASSEFNSASSENNPAGYEMNSRINAKNTQPACYGILRKTGFYTLQTINREIEAFKNKNYGYI